MLRSTIYKAIRDHSKTAMPELMFRDLQKGQLLQPQENYPIPLPALLVEFQGFRFSNMGEQAQIGDGTISLYLYLDLVTDSFDEAEQENETIELLDYMDAVYQAFEGFGIPGMSPLNRTNESKPQYGERFIAFRVDFSTSVDEQKISNQITSPTPLPEIAPIFKF